MNKDLIGNEIRIGDKVAFIEPNVRGLVIGKISHFSPYGATMEYRTWVWDNQWSDNKKKVWKTLSTNRPFKYLIKCYRENTTKCLQK